MFNWYYQSLKTHTLQSINLQQIFIFGWSIPLKFQATNITSVIQMQNLNLNFFNEPRKNIQARQHVSIQTFANILRFTITSLNEAEVKKNKMNQVLQYIKSNQVTFIYIALYTILIVSKQLYRVKQDCLSIMHEDINK